MCFSASASFGASALLTVIGIASIKKVRHPHHLLFASIPFMFGVQQFSEGILWLTLPNPDFIQTQKIFTYIFVFFAQVLWPIWVPIAIFRMDKNSGRKIIQRVFIAAGVLVGCYLGYCLLSFPINAVIEEHHIKYIQDYPDHFRNYIILPYGMATIVTPFISRIKHMPLLGATILISYVITAIFYDYYVLSVWCFFSSIISVSILAIMNEIYRTERKKIEVAILT